MTEFDIVVPRRGTTSVKWDEVPEGFTKDDMADVIPMWVADMDFRTAPCVRKAIADKLEHGIFGYTLPSGSYYDSIIGWFGKRHGWSISRESIIPIEGLVPGASVALASTCSAGDEVMVQTPAYNCFFSSVRNTGCKMSENKLVYNDGHYVVDFDDLAEKARTAKAFLLCNPQNPTGRLWTRDELRRMADICIENDLVIISDEIHCDVVPPGLHYTPMASLGEDVAQRCITLVSPTKCFNIAGLQAAALVSANAGYRKAMDRTINIWEHCDLNQIGATALPAAFSEEGAAWLDGLNSYIHENYLRLLEVFGKELPQLTVLPLESTYLVWVDCTALPVGTAEIKQKLLREAKVWINDGAMYGDGRFIRINIACPRSILDEALTRMVKCLKNI